MISLFWCFGFFSLLWFALFPFDNIVDPNLALIFNILELNNPNLGFLKDRLIWFNLRAKRVGLLLGVQTERARATLKKIHIMISAVLWFYLF